MIGKNTILLNRLEMARALDYYLNSVHFKETVAVTNVYENSMENVFVVSIADLPDAEKDDGETV